MHSSLRLKPANMSKCHVRLLEKVSRVMKRKGSTSKLSCAAKRQAKPGRACQPIRDHNAGWGARCRCHEFKYLEGGSQIMSVNRAWSSFKQCFTSSRNHASLVFYWTHMTINLSRFPSVTDKCTKSANLCLLLIITGSHITPTVYWAFFKALLMCELISFLWGVLGMYISSPIFRWALWVTCQSPHG